MKIIERYSRIRLLLTVGTFAIASAVTPGTPTLAQTKQDPKLSVTTQSKAQPQVKVTTGSTTPQFNPELFKAISGNIIRNYTFPTRNIIVSFPQSVKSKGEVTARNVKWHCGGNTCNALSVLAPQVSMCRAIVGAQGQAAIRFGDKDIQLSAADLAKCNTAANSLKITGGFVASVSDMVVSEEVETGAPGPSGVCENLLNQFGQSPEDVRKAEEDFSSAIGWSEQICQDGEDPSAWYYVPTEYRLALTASGQKPVEVSFTDTYESDSSDDKTVLMTATFAPPTTAGDLELLEALANSALRAENGEAIRLQPYPMTSLEVHLAESLSGLGIDEGDITITDKPRDVRDSLSVRVRMNEVAKTTLQSMMRERGGIGGGVLIRYDDERSAVVPLYMDLRQISGYPFPGIRELAQSRELNNSLYLPVTMTGIVGYVESGDGKLVRRYRPMVKTPRFKPRQEGSAIAISAQQAHEFSNVFGNNVVHSWFSYDVDDECRDCIAYAERMMESTVDVLRKDTLSIEIPEFVFADAGMFKVSVQIRSVYFDSSGSVEEIRDHQFRPGDGPQTESLFMERTRGADAPVGEYRFIAYPENGESANWSSWKPLYGTDLTLLTAEISQGGG